MPFYSLMNLIPILLRFSAQTGIGEAVGRGDAASAGRRLSALLATGVLAAAPLMLLLSLWRTATLRLLTAGAGVFLSNGVFNVILAPRADGSRAWTVAYLTAFAIAAVASALTLAVLRTPHAAAEPAEH